jgi:uncharacterized membrane protein
MIWILGNKSYAGTQKWNSLDYNATVNEDGSMNVVETWNIDISQTNTLVKDFDIDSSKYSGITNVKVARMNNGIEEDLTQIYQEQYHVDSGCFYALKTNSSTFEIAWNVGLDNSSATRTYKIYYTVNDAVKIYNDCTELYWMFLSTDNEISGSNITGTIKIPSGVTDIEKLRVWAHGDLTGNIQKESTDTVVFSIPTLQKQNMLEVRIVTEENIYTQCTNYSTNNTLTSILSEEQKWANKANQERMIEIIIIIVAIIIYALIFIFFLMKIIKYIKNGTEIKKVNYNINNIDYYREIPNESEATPARAAYLYYFNNYESVFEKYKSQIFSATILSLALKGAIEFQKDVDNDINIVIKDDNINSKIESDEQIVYDILIKTAGAKKTLNMNEIKKYAKENYDYFYHKMNSITRNAKSYQRDKCVNKRRESQSKKWNLKFITYTVLIIINIFLAPLLIFTFPIFIELIILAILCSKNSKKITVLNEKGYEEKMQWNGLKNYMTDFSLLKEKEVPDLVLWEKYLVYATAFGISKKVISQLKVVYPQMMDENYYNENYTYLYLMNDSYVHGNFMDSLEHGVSRACNAGISAYNIAHSSSSSGSGAGGGFSSGGGGRRRRRTVAVEDNQKNTYIV